MFHGFDYPDETGEDKLNARFWRPTMVNGVIRFPHPKEKDHAIRKFIRDMKPKQFVRDENLRAVDLEVAELQLEVGDGLD